MPKDATVVARHTQVSDAATPSHQEAPHATTEGRTWRTPLLLLLFAGLLVYNFLLRKVEIGSKSLREPGHSKTGGTVWKAAVASGSSVAELRCEGGSIADVVFKKGKLHAMCIHDSQEMISSKIISEGQWEPTLCQSFTKLGAIAAQRGTQRTKYWFLDVGSNIGFLSLCGYQSLPTVSIEAAPWNYNMVRQTGAHWQSGSPNKPWHVVNQAVSNHGGQKVKIIGSFENYGGSTLVNPENHPEHSTGWGEGAAIRTHEITTETLDNIVQKYIPPQDCVAVMKVDIEGFEFFAMQSATQFLRQRPPCNIFMEYHTVLLKASSSKDRSDRTPLKLVELMQAAGYVPDQQVPEDPSADAMLDLHWRLLYPSARSPCDCKGLIGDVASGGPPLASATPPPASAAPVSGGRPPTSGAEPHASPSKHTHSSFTELKCTGGSMADVIFKTENHHAMCIHDSQEMISAKIISEGQWEPDLCESFTQLGTIASKRTDSRFWFLDVGSNIGFLSLCGYQNMPVVSIEAAPWNFNMVSQTGAHWHSGIPGRPWHVVNKAVSNHGGQKMKMIGSSENYGGSTLVNPDNHPGHSTGWGEGDAIRTHEVTTETLDNIVNENIPHQDCVAVMKIDIEGFEFFAMQSAAQILRTRPPCNVFMEYHTVLLKASSSKDRSDRTPLKLFELMQAAGYVPDQQVPQDPSADAEINLHWRLMYPPAKSLCDCKGLLGHVTSGGPPLASATPPPASDSGDPVADSGGAADLQCTGGSKADVVFKREAFHAMCIHDSQEMISAKIISEGQWEPDLCESFTQIATIAEKDAGWKFWFLDVGSNIGFLSLCGYQNLPVVSIEAAPWNYNMVRQTAAHWHSGSPKRPWHVVNKAVSNRGGQTVKIIGSFQNYGGSTLVNPDNHPGHSDGWGEGEDIRTHEITTETLDNIVEKYIPVSDCVAVMKIDIEGFEFFAMQSASNFLRDRPPCNIFMEYHTVLLKASSSKDRSDRTPLKLVELMQAAGYVADIAVPEDPSADAELNLHWRLLHPPDQFHCDCKGLLGEVKSGGPPLDLGTPPPRHLV